MLYIIHYIIYCIDVYIYIFTYLWLYYVDVVLYIIHCILHFTYYIIRQCSVSRSVARPSFKDCLEQPLCLCDTKGHKTKTCSEGLGDDLVTFLMRFFIGCVYMLYIVYCILHIICYNMLCTILDMIIRYSVQYI